MEKNKKRGFTLVELLATIVILGVILSIVGYVVFDSMKKAKEKSYQVTISEIESNANNYMSENRNKIFFVTDNNTGNEYQCLIVKDLVDAGFLKATITNSLVANDVYVTENDYIYLERDGLTKSINKSVYIKKDNYTGSKDCDLAVNARGNIAFTVTPNNNTWSKTKNVTITYMLRNLGGEYDLANYDYTYNFDGIGTLTKDNGATKELHVTKEGNLGADIIYKPDGSQIYGDTIYIGRIDNIQPVVGLGNYKGSKTVSGSVSIPLVVTDKESGVDYGTFTKDDIEVTVGGKVPTSYSLTHGSGDNYTLTITDSNLDGVIKIVVGENKFTDKAGNGNKKSVIDNLDINFKNTYILSYSPGSCKDVSGAMTNQTVKYNANFTPKNNEYVCKGYTFNGWKDKNGTAFPIQSQKWTYTENKQLIAQWKVKSVKVTFYRNQTTSDAATVNQTFTYGASGNKFGFKTDGTPQWTQSGQFGTWDYTGRTLLGWSANRNATAKTWNTYSGVSDDWINNNSPSINIYGVWKLNTYTVSFNGNGGSVSTGSKTVTYSGTYGTLPTATRTGYTLDGWYTAASGGTKITATSNVTITNNQTLYAHWKANTYTITFNGNGGTPSPASKSVTYAGTYGTLATATRAGYTLDGWYTAASGGTKITATSKVTITNNQTLYAHWKVNTYTVTFNGNGGTPSPASKSVTYAGTYGTLATATRTGYTFNGWYTAASGGTKITATSKVTITNNQTLYAQWTVNKVNIRYHMNGGSWAGSTNTRFNASNSLVTYDGSTFNHAINYGGTGDLYNYNNASGINITRTEYKAVAGKEWCTGTSGNGTCYNQNTVYNATDFCNASNGNCTVTLYVNWQKQQTTYTVTLVTNEDSVYYGTINMQKPTGFTQAQRTFTIKMGEKYGSRLPDLYKLYFECLGFEVDANGMPKDCKYYITPSDGSRRKSVFNGWYPPNSSGCVKWLDETGLTHHQYCAKRSFSADRVTSESVFNAGKDITLYAYWTYTIVEDLSPSTGGGGGEACTCGACCCQSSSCGVGGDGGVHIFG